MKTSLRYKQSGSSLVVVMVILATLMVIVGIAVEYTVMVNRSVKRSNTLESAIAIGDGCMDILFANWRYTCRTPSTNATYTLKTSDLSAIATPIPSQFPTLQPTPTPSKFVKRGTSYNPSTDDATDYDPTYTISNYKVIAVGPEWAALSSANATPIPMLGQVTQAVTTVTPNTSAIFNYIASADVTLPALGANGNVVAKVRRVFQKQQLSPWNFAIFYVDPLEIHPGPLFTVTGWVHTNSDLYTAHNTLTFDDKVTYGGDWDIAFMPGDLQHLSDVPASPNYPSNLPPARDQSLQPFGMDSTSIFNTTDSNPNNDSYHELIEPPVNVSGNPDPLAGERYWDQASVIIQVSDNPNPNNRGTDNVKGDDIVTFYTVNNVLTGTTTPLTSGPLFNTLLGAISTNQTIQDNREGASVRVATLDVSQIENTVSSGNNPTYKTGVPASPIIYMYDSSATSSARRGIRIKNGSNIPVNGLTIASSNPVYIQGDFNSGRGIDSNGNGTPDNGVNPPSNLPSNLNSDGTYINTSNPPAPQVSGYTRAPTSILADAVTILSNSWSDAKSGTVPNASPTTVNTAVIAGIVPTGGYVPMNGSSPNDGSYSGGAENFPRFLENWTNDTLTYYGSMVELYKSQQSTGEWGKANVYDPPTREWLFDSNFMTKPPPGSIMVYSYIKGKWSVL